MAYISKNSEEPLPDREFSVSQLLYAAKRKLQNAMLGGRIVTTLNQAEIATLERDTLNVLSLLLSMKNTSAPINCIPPEVLSLIPDYWEYRHAEKDTIALTHVCHRWREVFTSRPSLWTHLDCRNADKTRVYIERSKSLPLKITLSEFYRAEYCDDALLTALPSLSRSDSLTISVFTSNTLSNLLDNLPFSALLLKEMEIILLQGNYARGVAVPSSIFPEHLSPLRKLSLSRVVTDLPWRHLSNLSVFEFDRGIYPDAEPFVMTKLLDFFESTPLLRKIVLRNFTLDSSTISPGRVVPLPNLKRFTANPFPALSTFFDHLSIPTGASLKMYFSFPESRHPIPVCLVNNFSDLHITTINLLLSASWHANMRLYGPSGKLHTSGEWGTWDGSTFFRSLCKFDLSNAQRLSIATYMPQPQFEIKDSPIFQPLLSMNNLRTLVLIETDHTPFTRALNPAENEFNTVLCPALEALVLYVERLSSLAIEDLKKMASGRAKRFSTLSSITIIGLGEAHPTKEVLSLREHVRRVEYKLEISPPSWDAVFGDNRDDEDYN